MDTNQTRATRDRLIELAGELTRIAYIDPDDDVAGAADEAGAALMAFLDLADLTTLRTIRPLVGAPEGGRVGS